MEKDVAIVEESICLRGVVSIQIGFRFRGNPIAVNFLGIYLLKSSYQRGNDSRP